MCTCLELVQLNRLKAHKYGNSKLTTLQKFLWKYEVEILTALEWVKTDKFLSEIGRTRISSTRTCTSTQYWDTMGGKIKETENWE